MKENSIPKIKLKKSQKLIKAGQKFYLCCSNFQNNNLWESASSCSFGFIFSFIPLILIILTILVGILRISPGLVNYAMTIAKELEPIVNISSLLQTILTMKNFHFIDLFLGVWIIWMARKLFLSIIQAMTKIFRSVSKRKGLFNQALIFISEFIIVFIVTAIILISFVTNQLVNSEKFEAVRDILPKIIVADGSHTVINFAMNFIIFICTVLFYRVISGIKPPFKLCFSYALLNTVCFYVISIWINKFMNLTNYNIVYGTISTMIILMMRVYFFFVLFLFFAQMIYVSQYFETLLQSEIYLLPTEEQKGWMNSFRRMVFVNPTALRTTTNTLYYKPGDILFNKGEKTGSVYYLRKGSIREEIDNDVVIYTQGDFISDTQCILNQPQPGTAIAETDCKIIMFTQEEFKQLLQKSPKAAAKAVSKISEDTAKFDFSMTIGTE